MEKKKRKKTIKEVHEHLGHLGTNALYYVMKETFFVKNLKKKIEDLVGECSSCISVKSQYNLCGRLKTKSTQEQYPFHTHYADIFHLL